MTEAHPARRRHRIVIAIVVVLMVAAILRVWLQPEVLVSVNTPIRFDDFTFAVVGSREANLPTSEGMRRFRLVSLKVSNEAKRVTYQFDPQIAVMIDGKGRQSGVSPRGQASLALSRTTPDPLARPLPAGASGTTELAFELPDAPEGLRLKISHGGPILDVVDDFLGGRRRLALK